MGAKVNKTELLKQISETTDEALLQQIQDLLSYGKEKDFWDDLTDQQKQDVDTGITQAKAGDTQDFYTVLKDLL